MLEPLPFEDSFSNEIKSAVGTLFLAASSGENALSMQLARLIAHPSQPCPTAYLSVWGMEISIKIIQIQTTGRIKLQPEHAESVFRLCKKIRNSYTRRNEIAHYCNAPSQRTDTIVLKTLKLKGDGTFQADKSYSVEQILDCARVLFFRVRQLDEMLTNAGIRAIEKYELPG